MIAQLYLEAAKSPPSSHFYIHQHQKLVVNPQFNLLRSLRADLISNSRPPEQPPEYDRLLKFFSLPDSRIELNIIIPAVSESKI